MDDHASITKQYLTKKRWLETENVSKNKRGILVTGDKRIDEVIK